MSHDDELMARYLAGAPEAFESLYDRYARRLVRFLLSLGATLDEAEDLAQATWMRVIDRCEQYRPRDRFRPWLFRIAHHLWIDHRRSAWERRREATETANGVLEAAPSRDGGPQQEAVRKEERDRVEAALRELPDVLREVVLLRFDAEMSYRQIAKAAGCPLGTALWRVHEACKRLRAILEEDG